MHEPEDFTAETLNTDGMAELFSFVNDFRKSAQRGITAVLADCPKCHFFMLERLHFAIKKHGSGGKIYATVLANSMREAPQGLSRMLRMLETEDLILRETDKKDRRKTLVSLTPAGEEQRRICEHALAVRLRSALDSYGEENLRELLAEARKLQRALENELTGTPE